MTSAACIAALLLAVLTGCAGVAPAPVSEQPRVATKPGAPVAPAPVVVAPAAKAEPSTPGAVQGPTPVAPAAPAAAPPAAGRVEPKPAAPAAKAPAKAPTPAAPAKEAAKKETPAPAKPAGPPPLDLKTLETRLKETNAIGVFTKLAIKNQVDDLLDQFKAFYQGRLKTTLAELRPPYDRLVLKVVALLQDADPPLASAIVASRETIWGILSDPAKFANY